MISTVWKCYYSPAGFDGRWGVCPRGSGGEKRGRGSGVGGWVEGGGFSRGLGHIRYIIHSSCEIEHLVGNHLCKLVCDTPIARITHICRSLLYAWC